VGVVVTNGRYFSNVGFALIATSALLLLAGYAHSYLTKRNRTETRLSADTFVSPVTDANLAHLESDVIISSIAANLLPPHLDKKTPEKAVPPKEAGAVIEEFKAKPAGEKRWERVRRAVLLVGSGVWFSLEVARAATYGGWKSVAFPVRLSK
jgi:hypothetical protein